VSTRDAQSAAALGMSVLEAVPAGSLRENTRVRLRKLVTDLGTHSGAADLRDALTDA
jgi:hypothetical protein